jgi:hypothetical protein
VSENVASLFGGPVGLRETNETCIAVLEDWLAKAKAGEIVGVALVGLCYDNLSLYSIGGKVGGYSMLGGLEMAKQDLIECNR